MLEPCQEGGLTWIRMAHGKANALDLELAEALHEAFEAAAADGSRAVVLTGRGSIFSAGVDLRRIVEGGADAVEPFLPALERAFRSLVRCPKPVVAAVNGHAIAGGLILACAADLCVLARGSAKLGVPELRVGVPFPPLGLEILRARLAPAPLRRALLTGRTFSTEEALEAGLADELVEPEALEERATALARDLGSIHPAAFARTKHDRLAPYLERAADPASLEAVLHLWRDPRTLAAVRDYVERTLG